MGQVWVKSGSGVPPGIFLFLRFFHRYPELLDGLLARLFHTDYAYGIFARVLFRWLSC